MKSQYKDPEVEVVCFEVEDVISTSGIVEVTTSKNDVSTPNYNTPLINIA